MSSFAAAKTTTRVSKLKHAVVYFLVILAAITLLANTFFYVSYEGSRFREGGLGLDDDAGVVSVPDPHKHGRKRRNRAVVREEEKRKKELFYNYENQHVVQKELKKKQLELEEKEKRDATKRERLKEKKTYRRQDRDFAMDLLEEAGFNTYNRTDLESSVLLPLDNSVVDKLPTFGTIRKRTALGGHEPPVIIGLDTCEKFRKSVPPSNRMVGPAGMFKTGTNLLGYLLKHNCRITDRIDRYGGNATDEQAGMRWQVPWGKHNPAGYKWTHTTSRAIEKVARKREDFVNTHFVLPVVTIRHPYSWMKSMCVRSFTVKWHHVDQCPHIKKRVYEDNRDDEKKKSYTYEWNTVNATYADGTQTYKSIAHLWNEWYQDYHKARYPRLVVRYEDLLFYAKETVTQICNCVGGELTPNFRYVLGNAQGDPGSHVRRKEGSDPYEGLIPAMIKNNKPIPRNGGFKTHQYEFARESLDETLMSDYGYIHPKPNQV